MTAAKAARRAIGQKAQRLTDLLTRSAGTGETERDTGDAHRSLRLISETPRNTGDGGDVRRGAHNPEVGGSNPPPATKARGPFSNRERASSSMRFVHGFVHGARSSGALARPDLQGGERASPMPGDHHHACQPITSGPRFPGRILSRPG